MFLRRFFVPCPFEKDELVTMTNEEYHHLTKVLRAKEKESYILVNGEGQSAKGTIVNITKNGTVFKIEEIKNVPKKTEQRVQISPSLLKNKDMSILIDKVAELGADVIAPIIFKRTESDYTKNTLLRWEKICQQAIKTNRYLWKCDTLEPLKLEDFIKKNTNKGKELLMLDIGAKPFEEVEDEIDFKKDKVIVIGPPGDYINSERALLLEAGFKSFGIGNHILRCETAAIVITGIINCIGR